MTIKLEKRKPLPFIPEPLVELRNRYEKALFVLYNVDRIRYMGYPGPGGQRDNVFDLKNGFRITISREFSPLNKEEERGPFEHITIEVFHRKRFEKYFRGLEEAPIQMALVQYHQISATNPQTKVPLFVDFDDEGKGILHIIFPSDFREGEVERMLKEMKGEEDENLDNSAGE